MKFAALYLTICFFMFQNLTFAQERSVRFTLFAGIEDFTLGKVNCITQDSLGYMWFSNQTQQCINRFDGYHMTSYRNDPKNPNSLGGTYPEVIVTAPSGIIWIGFFGMGIDQFDPQSGKFKHYRYNRKDPGSLSNDTVSALLLDHTGTLWVGSNGGLDRLDPKTGKFIHYRNSKTDPASLSSNRVRAIYEDHQQTIWIGTGSPFERPKQEGGLNRLNRKTGTFTRYLHDPGDPGTLINNKVRSIFEDSRGTFWVGTAGDGLHTMNRKTGRFKRHQYNAAKPDQLSRPPLSKTTGYDHITFIREDSTGAIWIGTFAAGLNRYDPARGKITHFGDRKNTPEDFGDNSCWWAYTSREGVLWMSTQLNNLYRIEPAHLTIPHTSVGSACTSFFEDPNKDLWVGTYAGLYKYRSNKILKHFVHDPRKANTISSNDVNEIYKDRQGRMWVGTSDGLNLYNPKTETFTRYKHDDNNSASISAGQVLTVHEDRQGSFWVGTLDGLDLMDRHSGTFTHYKHRPGDSTALGSNQITSIAEDKAGALWVGTFNGGGINLRNPRTRRFRQYLKGTSVTCLFYDSAGTVWVGTDLGIFKKTDGSKEFTAVRGPASELENISMTSILEDAEKNIWVGSMSGIFKLNAATNEISKYSRNYGIIPNEFDFPTGYMAPDGKLFFGDGTGFYSFYPEKLKINAKAPQVILTSFKIKDLPVKPGAGSVLSQPVELTKQITLKAGQNTFSFEFAGIHYNNPEENKHLFMLEGYEKNWRKAGGDKSAYYYNVPPGNYVFRVKSSGNNGIWAEKSVNLTITPPWWNTWWAYCLYGLLIIAVLFYADRYQRERLLKAEREKARTRELAQAKEIERAYHKLKATQAQLIQSEKMASLGELTAGIAHEIQNPLNFVNNFSEVNNELLEEMKAELVKGNNHDALTLAGQIKQNLEKINHHGNRADAIVKSMLQHSRTNNGIKEPTDINALADEYLRLSYHGLRAKDKSFNATIKTDFDSSVGKINVVPQDIGRVILNLLTNAFYIVGEKKKKILESAKNGHHFEPTVTISTRLLKSQGNGSASHVEIKVKDNGLGIPKTVAEKIFQPFFTTKPAGEGTGLGLSLSYDIVKSHGGELTVKSDEGTGTEFTISLPS